MSTKPKSTKSAKPKVKVSDIKPKKDAKGGFSWGKNLK